MALAIHSSPDVIKTVDSRIGAIGHSLRSIRLQNSARRRSRAFMGLMERAKESLIFDDEGEARLFLGEGPLIDNVETGNGVQISVCARLGEVSLHQVREGVVADIGTTVTATTVDRDSFDKINVALSRHIN